MQPTARPSAPRCPLLNLTLAVEVGVLSALEGIPHGLHKLEYRRLFRGKRARPKAAAPTMTTCILRNTVVLPLAVAAQTVVPPSGAKAPAHAAQPRTAATLTTTPMRPHGVLPATAATVSLKSNSCCNSSSRAEAKEAPPPRRFRPAARSEDFRHRRRAAALLCTTLLLPPLFTETMLSAAAAPRR